MCHIRATPGVHKRARLVSNGHCPAEPDAQHFTAQPGVAAWIAFARQYSPCGIEQVRLLTAPR